MRLGIDSDGVLADFDKSMVDGYNDYFGTDIKYKSLTHWDAFEEISGWSHQEWWDWVVHNHPRVFLDAPLIPGASRAMRALQDAGHTLCIITAKPKWAGGHMIEWLHNHDIPYDELHITSNKSTIECDVYIDDHVANVQDYLDNQPDAHVIQFFAWEYVNCGLEQPEVTGAAHCRSWDEVLAEIEKREAQNLVKW